MIIYRNSTSDIICQIIHTKKEMVVAGEIIWHYSNYFDPILNKFFRINDSLLKRVIGNNKQEISVLSDQIYKS